MKKTILLIAAAACMAAANACSNHGSHNHDAASPGETAQVENAATDGAHATLAVQGSCGMCKSRIEKAAKSVEGVTSASWDNAAQTLHLNFDAEKTSLEAVSKAVAAAGHDTGKDKAVDATYNALPGCCKYR